MTTDSWLSSDSNSSPAVRDLRSSSFGAPNSVKNLSTSTVATAEFTVHWPGIDLTLNEKTIKGSLFGSANPQYDIVKLLRLYDEGKLKLDELVTRRYTLEQVNEGYQDLRDGRNIRGVIIHAE